MSRPLTRSAAVAFLACAGVALSASPPARRSDPLPGRASDRLAEWSRAEREWQLAEHRGTEIAARPDLVDPVPGLAEQLGRLFALQAEAPRARLEYFRWCDRPELGVRGWYGAIEEIEPGPDGWVVRVSVSPHLVSRFACVTSTGSRFLETYEYSPDGLRFVGGRALEGPGSGLLFGD